ncbi:hypothetical protein FG379_003325, partial [Cryptosporidium bovis]|uniref:uncharacterized protein n=1 Tax=Cryptosporidium bovis TaxID=310047 RepID=UPI00351A4EB9
MKDYSGKMDIIINSLIEDYIPNSLYLLKKGGCFVELGKRGVWTEEEMRNKRPDVKYKTVAIDVMMEENPKWFGKMLDRIKRRVEDGMIKSLPLRIFNMRGSEENGIDAFRFMQRAQHIGKVVIKIPTPFKYMELKSSSVIDEGNGEKEIDEYGVQVITGGLGGLGKVIIKWMLEEGVRKIAVLSRSASNDSLKEIREIDEYLKSELIQIECIKCDVSKKKDVMNAFNDIKNKFGKSTPIHGIFHAAGILMDGAIASQTIEAMESVYAPKVYGGWNLHECCESLKLTELKHF